MRIPIIAGNWKMFKDRDEALKFIYVVTDRLPLKDKVESVICAPSVFLRSLVKRQGEQLRIGAQNMHFADQGAYTGEISADMLKSINVEYVIIGHSERRAMFNETDESVNKKLHQAFKNDLNPILCVGESLEVRESGKTEELVGRQVELALEGLEKTKVSKLIIAYERIWAIGTGKTATSEQAEEMCKFIRNKVRNLYDEKTADKMRIQYGGSVKLSNIDELMNMPNIDGALIGGASLNPEDFIKLVEAALK
ncbi:MAG: triose-phosphate isomerase [Bacilli bacterium]